jgi:hypothetical protein
VDLTLRGRGMPEFLRTQWAIARATLFSARTGPFLWSGALGVAFYFILVVLHAWGRSMPARMLNVLELYTQVFTILASIALAVQALTMFAYIKLNDEFMRVFVYKRLALGALVTIVVVTIWSLLADMGWAPSFEPIYLYLLFLGVMALLLPFMNADRP